MDLNPSQLKEIEKQLSCPVGESGLKIADNMHESNISMTLSSIEALNLSANDEILEIGHGNCGHLPHILETEKGLIFTGLEISEAMQKEAKRINHKYDADFQLYDGETLPFNDNSFNKIFSVNTIYFWKDSIGFIKEIERVLTDNGTLVLTFALKSFMQKLPFVKSAFELYDEVDLRELISSSKMEIETINQKTEKIRSKSGELVERSYLVSRIKKSIS